MTIILIILLVIIVVLLAVICAYSEAVNDIKNKQLQQSFLNEDGHHIYYDRQLIKWINEQRYKKQSQ